MDDLLVLVARELDHGRKPKLSRDEATTLTAAGMICNRGRGWKLTPAGRREALRLSHELDVDEPVNA